MNLRTAAGANERRFEAIMHQKFRDIKLLGKRRFFSDKVEISVDQSFVHEGMDCLIEVDSANMAKLLVGQYVLINQLYAHKDRVITPFFLVVHTYKNYNPERTLLNLNLVNKQLYKGSGIAFGAVHIDSLSHHTFDLYKFLNLTCHPSI